MMTVELWKDIPGYEGLYQASNFGRIRSRYRILSKCWRKRRSGQNQDAIVCLSKDGKARTFLVARLVGMVWVPGYRPELTINHINGNSLDNRPENMEWVTVSENVLIGHFMRQFDAHHRPCTLIDSHGRTYDFDMQKDAEAFLGRPKCYIANAKKRSTEVYSITGERYTLLQ